MRTHIGLLFVAPLSLFRAAALGPTLATLATGTEQLGQVNFPVACDAPVQPAFNRAVALQHSFDAAAKAFGAVAKRDQSCVMAYWASP
jgi:hypothetical protein